MRLQQQLLRTVRRVTCKAVLTDSGMAWLLAVLAAIGVQADW